MIEINSRYAINSDSNQWMLCKPVKATEKKPAHWVAFKYYASLSACLDALRGILLRTSDYQSFADLERNAREITKLLEKKMRSTV